MASLPQCRQFPEWALGTHPTAQCLVGVKPKQRQVLLFWISGLAAVKGSCKKLRLKLDSAAKQNRQDYARHRYTSFFYCAHGRAYCWAYLFHRCCVKPVPQFACSVRYSPPTCCGRGGGGMTKTIRGNMSLHSTIVAWLSFKGGRVIQCWATICTV